MPRLDWSPWAWLVSGLACVHLAVATSALHYSDFAMIHATSVALRSGAPAYAPVVLLDGVWANLNPPQLNLLIWPLAYLSLPAAAWIFRVANFVALACAVALVMSPREIASRRGGWVIAAALLSPALVLQSGAGQLAGLLSLAVAWAWRALLAARDRQAGVAVGLLCALKPIFLPVFLWLALSRRWLGCFAAAATGIAVVLASIACWGIRPQLDWLAAVHTVTWFDSRFNMAWPVLPAAVLGGSAALSYTVVVVVGQALGAGLAWAYARRDAREALLALLAGSIWTAPLGWLYYLCVPGPLLMQWAAAGPRWPILAWLLWIPLPFVPQTTTSLWWRLTIGLAYFWGLTVLLARLLRERYLAKS
jgi:hypothetical protein